jgi:glycosyltransferase involved in cell wall biosynthesis
MNLLVCLPVFRNAALVDRCLKAIVDTPATILVVDNAADAETKAVLVKYKDRIEWLENPENMNCNWAWNKGLERADEFDVIALGSSDVVLPPHWYETVEKRLHDYSDEVLLPDVGPHTETVASPDSEHGTVSENIAGAFTFMSATAARIVRPIPSSLKFWFGDEWMFTILRRLGWKTVVLTDLKAYHLQSSSMNVEPSLYQTIEEDKKAWDQIQPIMEVKLRVYE